FATRVRVLCGAQIRGFIERQLLAIDALTTQIRLADRELRTMARQDPLCRRLMTVPGVGWLTALRYVAALDEVDRFSHGHRVAAYLGLVPGERSSSERQQRTGITKAGSPSTRWTLVQAAWAARRAHRKDAMQRWADEIERRRGKAVAVVAL